MRVLTTDGARRIDERAIEELGLPGVVLMENAAVAAADMIRCRYPEVQRVALCCGPGNNGGDGLALARQLSERGYDVSVFLFCARDRLRGDAALQSDICTAIGIGLREVDDSSLAAALDDIAATELIVDSLLGTGLSRAVEGLLAATIDGLNALDRPILAIDLPSGLEGGSPAIPGPHVDASSTLTFFAPKVANVLPPAADATGELWLSRLSVPSAWIDEEPAELHLLCLSELELPSRSADSHKGSYGHVLLVAGSRGKSGAAVLAAKAALRSGAGLVSAAVAESALADVETGCTEAMSIPLSDGVDGTLKASAVDDVRAAWSGKQVIAIGPGLGTDSQTAACIRTIAVEAPLPLVLDADGISAFSGRAGDLAQRREGTTLLTPHPGEIARLLEIDVPRSAEERLRAVRQAAERANAVVILKGHRSLICRPDGELWVNTSGNSGMATAGSGDVLTGAAAAWLAQTESVLDGARIATFVHGLAGDLAARQWGERSLMAGDLLACLPLALRLLEARAVTPLRRAVRPIGRAEIEAVLR
ncbi:MAG: NAD(P)H-hydrate dehydratase [Acidobacteria bacterium]|nr:NAD(P)H-hydrate dehydratase [Acidobacteriota bacterium]